jgi:hypothetical protein
MDLNVKLQGLQYNFGKGQGCFYKINGPWRFSRLIELIFYRKGIDRVYVPVDRVHGVPAHRSTDHIKLQSLIL